MTFLDQHTGQTPGLILTLNGSEDAESRKNVPFEISDPTSIRQILAQNRQFEAKIVKQESPSVS